MADKPRSFGEAVEAWSWRRRTEVHKEARDQVDFVARYDEATDKLGLPLVTRLYESYFLHHDRKLTVTPGKHGAAWWKAGWENEAGKWYVLVWEAPGHTVESAIRDLCEVIEEVRLGFRKPSRDVYKPKKSPGNS